VHDVLGMQVLNPLDELHKHLQHAQPPERQARQ
jgi:hypothetical protein